MRISYDAWALEIARLVARRSTCCRRHVGCVLVDERGHILATGYNGVAAGLPHCNHRTDEGHYPYICQGCDSPSGTDLDGCQAIHAEQNALLQCRDVHEIAALYTTCSPCVTCTKLLLNTSCQRIVFAERYPQAEAQELWDNTGRRWEQLIS